MTARVVGAACENRHVTDTADSSATTHQLVPMPPGKDPNGFACSCGNRWYPGPSLMRKPRWQRCPNSEPAADTALVTP